ncbi:LuxR family transcriptional regulator [Symbioplanes lichenis]|uniref:LuxR family transcriptional regulator n=1 Tax=Symbioplanes lichenis TaxID=1629072 RepID=UPI0027390707|nr:LuxR family transcriptional regulator [Actinoplanes lichenis]
MVVVVGVDGAGRTHRLRELAADAAAPAWWPTALTGPPGRLILVDDAHRLDATALRELTAAARAGEDLAMARRPTIQQPELAELDEAAAAGGVEILAPLGPDGVARLVATITGRPVSPAVAAAVLAASAGLPAVAAAVAAAPPDTPAPALLARVQRRFAALDPPIVTVARMLALELDLPDHVLAEASKAEVATALRILRDEGLLVPDGDRMIPAVAVAVLAELPAAERRRLHDAVARALLAARADPVTAATQLRAARAVTPVAATVYREAGERLRFDDPAGALGWFDDAVDAGAEPATVAAGRAEASALLGLPIETDQAGVDADRLALVEGAVAAHHGRSARAAELLLSAAGPGTVLAVPSQVGLGQVPTPTAQAPTALLRLAEGARAAGDPEAALPMLIEAAEEYERRPPALVLPDTPHALAAVVAVTAGDVATAEDLLRRSGDAGGPVFAERHRLLLAWARMRAGRYDTALAELSRRPGAEQPGRERLLRAAVAAGIARRRGDIAGLREAWTGAEPLLARRTADLWQLEAIEELAVAAARLRRPGRAEPVLELLEAIVTRLGRPPAWSVALGWIRLHMAVVTEDADAAAKVAGQLSTVVTGAARPRAQCAAAELWAGVLAGDVDPAATVAVTEELHAAELPWEASRLAGQAAVRTSDAVAARHLLERARELAEPDRAATATGDAGLSDRELAVARLVLAGSTHREIGAQLYIAPKTVEHHVARIRVKLGTTTRAEMLAVLREILTR